MKSVIRLPLKHNEHGDIIFKPDAKFIVFILSCIATIIGAIAGGSIWVKSVSGAAKQVPVLSQRMDNVEVMQVGVWCIQKEILKKLDPTNANQRIEQIEVMMETMKKQQEYRRDNKE